MFFLTLQQAGILDGTPFQSYQAQSGLPGWAQLQGQAESGKVCGKAHPRCQGGKAPSGFGFQSRRVHSVSSPVGRNTVKRPHSNGIKGRTSGRRVWVSAAESLVQDWTHTGPRASMGSELQFCWLLNQQSAQLARPLCAPPPGGWGTLPVDTGHLPWGLQEPRTLPPSLLLCVLDSSGLPASINIHAHPQSQGQVAFGLKSCCGARGL